MHCAVDGVEALGWPAERAVEGHPVPVRGRSQPASQFIVRPRLFFMIYFLLFLFLYSFTSSLIRAHFASAAPLFTPISLTFSLTLTPTVTRFLLLVLLRVCFLVCLRLLASTAPRTLLLLLPALRSLLLCRL